MNTPNLTSKNMALEKKSSYSMQCAVLGWTLEQKKDIGGEVG